MLSGIGLLLRGRRQQSIEEKQSVLDRANWFGLASDALSDCSTATPNDVSDDEVCSSSDSPKSEAAPKGEALLLFDWDDTLLATSYLRQLLGDMKDISEAPADIRTKLARHAAQITTTLITARSAGRVSIVTLSARPWVTQSAERYFPGMGIPALLDELGVTVHYAQEHATAPCAPSLAHFAGLKRSAMSRCLAESATKPESVISIGDSIVEQCALRQLLSPWDRIRSDSQSPFCKIVKLMDGPTLQDLTDELAFLEPWLCTMAAQQSHFQLCIAGNADLRSSALDFVKRLRLGPSP